MTPTRSSSTAVHSPSVLPERRDWRRSSGLSVTSPAAESRPAPAVADNGHPPMITEEISEIKRYEDFTTIDWVQDAVHEQARRRAKRREGFGFWEKEGALGWRRKVSESYDAGQAWLVVTIVGAAIGLNSALLNIITEWLSDIKLGYCTTGFYLNEQFCCWGAEGGTLYCETPMNWLQIMEGKCLLFAFFYQVALNGNIGPPSGLRTMSYTSSLPYAHPANSALSG